MEFVDLTRRKINKWTVIKIAQRRRRVIYWLCECECGTVRAVGGGNLRSGRSKGCGCDRRGGFLPTHGKTGTKIHRTWGMMRSRCANQKLASWKNYGARGIRVCKRWDRFENFYADMGEPPTANHSIERINNDGNYEPGNCRWATREEQNRNTRRTRFYEMNGVKKTPAEWAEAHGLPAKAVRKRLWKGWPIERAVTEPLRLLRKSV